MKLTGCKNEKDLDLDSDKAIVEIKNAKNVGLFRENLQFGVATEKTGASIPASDFTLLEKCKQQICQGQPKKSNFLIEYFKRKSKCWNKNQFVTILILSFVEFFAAAVVSILAPFYPQVAREKGSVASEYGLVFAIFEITVFIMSPIYGAKMDFLQPRRVFNWGILTTGICCVIFGLLDAIENQNAFFWACLVVRTVEAMGDAAFDTASFTIIAMEFPNSVGTSFAILEISYGLGLILGPTVGGLLYELGGYSLPFMTMGGFLFAAAIATYLFLPEFSHKTNKTVAVTGSEETPATSGPVARGGFQMFRMLKIPMIGMTAYSIVSATAGVGFISANLDYHLDKFDLSKVQVGGVFVMSGGVYAITAPLWGYICDHTSHQKLITFSGAVFTILGFVFIGPVPYFPYDTSVAMACIGLALFGFGLAATLVSAFLQILNDAISHGYPDDISTYGLVSGLWTSMSALGYFIGPSIGGVAVDSFGFRWSSLFVIAAQLILIILLSAYFISCRLARTSRNNNICEENQDMSQIGVTEHAKISKINENQDQVRSSHCP